MKIYALFYEDTGLYNRSIFIVPNDEAAKKGMKLNLMDSRAEQFKNEVKMGHVILRCLAEFEEDKGITITNEYDEVNEDKGGYLYEVCNLKELLDEDNRNSESIQ